MIAQAESKEDIQAVQALWREFTSWAFTLTEGSENAPTFDNLEQELATLPGIYVPPTGRLLLAKQNNQPAGTVALKGHNNHTAEVKRLYVRPDFRGLRIGQQLVGQVIEEAKQTGYTRLILDSHKMMTQAHGIYQGFGFKFVPTPADFPEAIKPIVVFMECDLA